MKWFLSFLLALVVASSLHGDDSFPKSPPDLTTPRMEVGEPAAGKRVRQQLPEFAGSELFHALYLPTNWTAEQAKQNIFPVIFEYPGNGPYQDSRGDKNSGFLEDCNLGYGVSAGKDFIWVCLPFVNDQRQHQRQWWGNAEATADYCQKAVKLVCEQFGGDRSRLVLAGFSRGAIACNYIGLRNDEIAGLWRAFIVHSHYDGVRRWPYADSDAESAKQRLARLKNRPQFISHEGAGVDETRAFLKAAGVTAPFTFVPLPFPNHTDSWVLRDNPERQQLRDWLTRSLATESNAARRPKVLLLGDSISLGYTPVVKRLLAEVADVSRPNENCQHSAHGVANIKKWLGDEKWDVIHFNWGIWDTHWLNPNGGLIRNEAVYQGPTRIRHTPNQYRENLEKIIAAMQATGASLVFSNTTPIMYREGKRFEDIKNYNSTAAELMKAKQIPVIDLYEFVLPNAKAWQSADKVHFNATGNEQLGKKVSDAIRAALPVR